MNTISNDCDPVSLFISPWTKKEAHTITGFVHMHNPQIVPTWNQNANNAQDTLVYSCVCDNNVSPNITMYTQTLPYYICTEWGNQCVKNCGLGQNTCANDCRANHPCGAQNTKPPNSTVLSTMSSTRAPTATGGNNAASSTVPVDGFLGATATGNSDNHKGVASSMLNLGQSYGLAVVFAGVFAGFAIIL